MDFLAVTFRGQLDTGDYGHPLHIVLLILVEMTNTIYRVMVCDGYRTETCLFGSRQHFLRGQPAIGE